MPETKKRLLKNSGFTLIELLVAIAISSVMMAAVASAYWTQMQNSRKQQLVVDMQQNLRAAMYMMERDFMMAGYDDDRNNPPAATILAALPTRFSFQYVDDSNSQVTVTYDIYDALGDGDFDIGRSVNGNPRQAIAENIEGLEFYYTLADGTQALTPADPEDVRAVGISVLARTSHATRELDNMTYDSLSGSTNGPFNDHFIRQQITAMVICRNMM